jgi:hypothetical protein
MFLTYGILRLWFQCKVVNQQVNSKSESFLISSTNLLPCFRKDDESETLSITPVVWFINSIFVFARMTK